MGLKMKFLSSELVRPSSQTKDDCKKYHLSSLDELIPHFSLPLLLYYHRHDVDNFSSRLKESLSDVLTMFYPLAGRLKRGETSVDCNDVGVPYSEAEVDSEIADVIEAGRLEPELLDPLIPTITTFMYDEDKDDHESLLLAIQINYFNCGGIAIGARMAHKIADACSYISFITTWATLAHKGNVTPPSLISSSLFPSANQKLLLRSFFPLPNQKLLNIDIQYVTRRFVFDALMISYLRAKARVDRPDMMEPTRVGAVSAFIWKHSSTSTSTGGGTEKQYMMAQGVNLRPRMVPPLRDHVFGNLIVPALAIAFHKETLDLGTMAGKIRERVDAIDDKFIRWYGLEGGYAAIPEKSSGEQLASEILFLSSWCRFPVYEIDFGMGKPAWVGFASGVVKKSVFLMDDKFGQGLEAWVTMPQPNLTTLELAFKEANYNNTA